MATSTSNYNLNKPSPEDFYDIEVQNENLEVIDQKLKELETGVDQVREAFEGHRSELKYQTASGSNAITITTGGSFAYTQGNPVKWIQAAANTGAVTINIDSKGIKALKNSDGSALSSGDLEAGKAYEAYYSSGDDFFTLRPRGGGDMGFYGKYAEGDINVTTPISAASVNYTTYASARPQVLSNGWIVAPAADETNKAIIIMVSKDGGSSWSTLCTISNGTVNSSDALSFGGGLSCTSSSNNIYILCWRMSSSGSKGTICYWTINAATQTNTNVYSTKVDIEEQNTIGSGCHIAIDSSSALHAVWSSKNAPYSNSFNIRYSKSTDNGFIWATVSQKTTENDSGRYFSNPNIVFKSNGEPIVIGLFFNTPYYSIVNIDGNLIDRNTVKTVYSGGAYSQSSPNAVVTNDGVIHVVWHGLDTTDASAQNVRYSKSYDGGSTWSAMTKLTSGNTYGKLRACISANNANNLFVVFDGGDSVVNSWSNINILKNINGTWGSMVKLTTNASASAAIATVCDNYRNFIEPIFMYRDDQAAKVKFMGVSAASEITLVSKVKQGSYIYSNEDVQLILDTPVDLPINRSTPITVANSDYATSNNARPQVLSNGWIVNAMLDLGTSKYVKLYVSKDRGATFPFVITSMATDSSLSNLSVTSNGTTVHIIFSAAGVIYYNKLDISSISFPYSLNSGWVAIDTQFAPVGSGSHIVVDSTGVLHAVWCSKNATYQNSFNIRYSKSSTGGATWDTVAQVTKQNTSGDYFQNPVLILRNDVAYIICENKWGTNYEIDIFNNTSGWTPGGVTNWGGKTIFSMSSYVQRTPSATITDDGVIHVVWAGYDSNDTKSLNLKYSYSSDGGNTWNSMEKVTTGGSTTSSLYDRTYPCITSNAENKLWIACSARDGTSTTENLMLINNLSGSWVSNFITSYTNGSAYYYPSVCNNYNLFSEPICVYQENQASAVRFRGVYTMRTNQQIIPSINNAASAVYMSAAGNGTLKALGTSLKRYLGVVSRKSKGWS